MPNTSTVTPDLDVISKYNSIVKESLGPDSVYIRSKETIEQMYKDSSIDDSKKAEIIGNIVGGTLGSIATAAMSTALEWSKQEKELELKKLELDQQLAILEQEGLLKTAQVAQVEAQTRLALIESKRMYGTGTFLDGALTMLTEEGKVWGDMQLTAQQKTNAEAEEALLASKLNESKVAIHKVVADTYTNFGNYEFTLDVSGYGVSTVTRLDKVESGEHISLSDTQQNIAIEQGKGYTYNAWANALTGSASVLGTAISSGDFSFASGTKGDILLRTVINCANNLAVSSGAAEDATPVEKVSVPADVSNDA